MTRCMTTTTTVENTRELLCGIPLAHVMNQPRVGDFGSLRDGVNGCPASFERQSSAMDFHQIPRGQGQTDAQCLWFAQDTVPLWIALKTSRNFGRSERSVHIGTRHRRHEVGSISRIIFERLSPAVQPSSPADSRGALRISVSGVTTWAGDCRCFE